MLIWTETLAPALQERLVLWLNHVLSREPAAMAKLLPYAGKQLGVAVRGAPAWAPPLPDLQLAITPAGLFERVEPAEAALRIEIDASNPMASALAALKGRREGVSVSGDAGLAGAVNWLFDNLRWDPADDLARFVGPAPAQMFEQMGQGLKAALASLLQKR